MDVGLLLPKNLLLDTLARSVAGGTRWKPTRSPRVREDNRESAMDDANPVRASAHSPCHRQVCTRPAARGREQVGGPYGRHLRPWPLRALMTIFGRNLDQRGLASVRGRSGAELTSLILTDGCAFSSSVCSTTRAQARPVQPLRGRDARGGERLHVVIPPVTDRRGRQHPQAHQDSAPTLDDWSRSTYSPSMRDFGCRRLRGTLHPRLGQHKPAQKATLLRARGSCPGRAASSPARRSSSGLANWDHVACRRARPAQGTGEITLRDLVRESLHAPST